jgi:hypothetical protein
VGGWVGECVRMWRWGWVSVGGKTRLPYVRARSRVDAVRAWSLKNSATRMMLNSTSSLVPAPTDLPSVLSSHSSARAYAECTHAHTHAYISGTAHPTPPTSFTGNHALTYAPAKTERERERDTYIRTNSDTHSHTHSLFRPYAGGARVQGHARGPCRR